MFGTSLPGITDVLICCDCEDAGKLGTFKSFLGLRGMNVTVATSDFVAANSIKMGYPHPLIVIIGDMGQWKETMKKKLPHSPVVRFYHPDIVYR
jgi:hypothetical protein